LSGKLGKIWAKIVLKVLSFEKCPQNKMKSSRFCFFFQVICFGVFSGKFGEIWAKILCTPKNLPASTPMGLATSGIAYIANLPHFIFGLPDMQATSHG